MTAAQLADFNCIAGQLAGWHGELVTPAQWKGAVPKEVHQPRILAALTAAEQGVLDAAKVAPTLKNNVVDAIGLGLWAVGRLGQPVPVIFKPKRRRAVRRKASVVFRMPKGLPSAA